MDNFFLYSYTCVCFYIITYIITEVQRFRDEQKSLDYLKIDAVLNIVHLYRDH